MTNIPKTIYLQIGEDCPTDDSEDFNARCKILYHCRLKQAKEYCEKNFNHN